MILALHFINAVYPSYYYFNVYSVFPFSHHLLSSVCCILGTHFDLDWTHFKASVALLVAACWKAQASIFRVTLCLCQLGAPGEPSTKMGPGAQRASKLPKGMVS